SRSPRRSRQEPPTQAIGRNPDPLQRVVILDRHHQANLVTPLPVIGSVPPDSGQAAARWLQPAGKVSPTRKKISSDVTKGSEERIYVGFSLRLAWRGPPCQRVLLIR